MSTPDRPPHVAIKQWEEAGASLLAAFNHYVDICTRLDTKSSKEPAALASRIDSTLEKVHTVMFNQLPKITSTLLKSRNALMSSISHLPEEVLSKIFGSFIFDYHHADGEVPLTTQQCVQLTFARLYTLCSVCSAWRDIGMARGALWSVVPLVVDPSTNELRPYQPSLERAGGSQLHMAAVVGSAKVRSYLYEIFSEYGPRFGTINLSVHRLMRETMRSFINRLSNNIGSLSELSIMLYDTPTAVSNTWERNYDDWTDTHNPPEPTLPLDSDYIFPRNSPHQVSFSSLLSSLTAFRISSVQIHWNNTAFSSRLVELLIHDVNLGYDDAISPFLQALSSASELRDLKIVSLRTHYRGIAAPGVDALPAISLPKLESLFLGGLYFNTLKNLLSIISPRSHSLTLSLDSRSCDILRIRQTLMIFADEGEANEVQVHDGPNDDHVDIAERWATLGAIRVDTLIISRGETLFWLNPTVFQTMLRVIRGLKTLKLDNWYYGINHDFSISNLKRLHGTQSNPKDDLFPALECLHLTRVTMSSKEMPALKEVVASHTLREIVLGGKVDLNIDPGAPPSYQAYSFRAYSDLVEWLRINAPHTRLVDEKYRPAELYSGWWRLW